MQIEILALRHQLAVINRSRRPHLRLTAADRMLWAGLLRAWRNWRSALIIVKPETVRLASTRLSSVLDLEESPAHRPTGVPADVRALIRHLSCANPLGVHRGFTANC